MINRISKITGLIPVNYADLTKEQKENSCFIHTECFDNFSEDEFARILSSDEIKNKIADGYSHIVDQNVICIKIFDFLELPEDCYISDSIKFTDPDTAQSYYRNGICISKYFLLLRLIKL